ncbi:MAG: cobalamin biosynthesis protein [Desulfotomaculales bacterium]
MGESGAELAVLVAAVLLDLVLGEPPARVHPVVWVGRLLGRLEKGAPRGPAGRFLYGAFMVLVVALLFAGTAWVMLHRVRVAGGAVYVIVGALLLKPCFALRALFAAVRLVEGLLAKGDLPAARRELRALVSRDTASLEASGVRAAAIESLAENTCDSFVAPTFYFLLFGVPGAVCYRVVNTADAMFGYRGEYEYLGKFAARLDDVLNFVPARLTGLLIVAAAWLLRHNGTGAWRVMWRDRRRTPSPNAGWPMAAMAGALGVELSKPDHYRLNRGAGFPAAAHGPAALSLARAAAALWLALAGVTLVAIGGR